MPPSSLHAAELEAVVVEDALHPAAPHLAVGAVGQHRRVLDRNRDLVVEAVRHPAANLLGRGAPAVEHHVERVVDVVRAATLAQLGFELGAAPGRAPGRCGGGHVHACLGVITSECPCGPRRPRCACALQQRALGRVFVEDRVGVVDVDEQPPRRAGSLSSHSIMPPGPDCGRWPMSRAVFLTGPGAIISSSVQKVPSTSTASAPHIASNSAGVISPRPGA